MNFARDTCIAKSAGPEIALFKWFQRFWVNLDVLKHDVGIDNLLVMRRIGKDLFDFAKGEVVIQQTNSWCYVVIIFIDGPLSRNHCISSTRRISPYHMDIESYLLIQLISFSKWNFFDSVGIAHFERYFYIYSKYIHKSFVQYSFSLQSTIPVFDVFKGPTFLELFK